MEAPQQEIQFGNVFVDNATRVDYSNENALQGFTVYGTVTGKGNTVALFNGDGATVERKGAAYLAAWTCLESEYWVPGADYKFAAVVDATASVDGGLPTTLTTVADDAQTGNMNLKDMLYAEASVDKATADQGIVNFTFSHLLSKVKFTVTSDAPGDYKHTVKNITVANYDSGTYYIQTVDENAAGTWAGGTAKNVEFAEIANVTNNTGAMSNAEKLLVPNAGTFKVTFTVDLYKGSTLIGTQNYEKYVTIEDGETPVGLQKGHAYNFTITCSMGNPIQFSVTNDPTWSDGGNVNIQ